MGGAAMANLLLVEDERVHRQIIVRYLLRAGHNVRAGAHRDEAILAALRETPDLAIIDYRLMDSETGAEAARSLRALCPAMPLLFISGMPYEAIACELHGLKPYRFLEKPFSLEALRRAIEEALGGTPALAATL